MTIKILSGIPAKKQHRLNATIVFSGSTDMRMPFPGQRRWIFSWLAIGTTLPFVTWLFSLYGNYSNLPDADLGEVHTKASIISGASWVCVAVPEYDASWPPLLGEPLFDSVIATVPTDSSTDQKERVATVLK